MVEAGAKEVPEEQVAQALEAGHAAIKKIVATIDVARQGRRQAEAPGGGQGRATPDLRARGRAEGARAAHRGDAAASDKLENYAPRRQGPGGAAGRLRRGRAGAQGRRQEHLQGAEGESAARRSARAPRAPRRPQVRRDPVHLDRGRRAAPHARLGRLHARRDAGARHLHARHGRRPAEDRARRRRVLQALHAALQLPAVLGRRSAVHARPRPPRSGPRRPGRARARRRSFRPRRSSPTRFASCRTSSRATAARRWRRSAAARCR